MSFQLADWGRAPRLWFVILVIVRLPNVVPAESTAGLLGAITGTIVGAWLLVGIIHTVHGYYRNYRSESSADTA